PCTLVTCGQWYSLAKVSSGSAVAARTYAYRIECGRWTSLSGEASRPRAYPHLRTRGGSGPPRWGVCSLPVVRIVCGVRDPVGGPGPSAVWLSAPFSGTRGDTGPVPSGKLVRDCWSGVKEPDPRGLATQLLRA